MEHAHAFSGRPEAHQQPARYFRPGVGQTDCNTLCKVRVVTRPITITTKKPSTQRFFSDYTATTILGKFQNDAAGRSVQRVLEKLSKKKAVDILAVSSTANLGHPVLLPMCQTPQPPLPSHTS